jgi:oligopeptidase A
MTTSSVAAATTIVTANPLLQQEGLPKFAEIEPSNVTPAVQELLAKLEVDFADLETDLGSRSSSISYDDALPKVERIQHGLEYAWGVTGHLNGVKNSDDLRKAYEENQPEIVQIFSKFKQSKVLFDALNQIQQRDLPSPQEGEEDVSFAMKQRQRAIQNSLRAMKLGGVGLTGEAKERFNEIKQRLAAIATTFSNNVLDETKAFSLTITDKMQLEGVPDSAKAMWAQAHVAELKKQNPEASEEIVMDAENGPWRITLDMPSYLAVLSHVRDRTIRETVYRANIQRASEKNEAKNNIPLIYEILQLRKEMAGLLGFSNYAELSLASKMAPTIVSVQELSDLIRDKALPAAEKELAEITALAQQTSPELEKLEPWDITFWSERLKESKFDLTEEETRPYFALPAVLGGMFALVHRLFGVRVEAADGEAQVWHPDVRFFKIYNGDDNTHIASFYLDPYSRPENKRGGAWMDTCLGKSAAVGIDVPVAYLTCNGSPPVRTTPSLMTFREVETLFHEFGHGLQHMLTKASVGDVAGINGIEWDAVELPSQFMENWCYDRPTVYGFAKHWETGEPMPEEMFEKLCQQKTYNAGMMACRQLLFGQLDMELHSKYDAAKGKDGEGESIFDVHRRMAEKYTPYNLPLPEDRFLCAFSHIFAGGYAAGYYR